MKKILLACLFLSLNCFADCLKYDSCTLDDDEYCIYNQCYFDRHYRKFKSKISLNENQEKEIDSIYQFFKYEMEKEYFEYYRQKNKVLNLIECNNKNYKKELKILSQQEKEAKIKYYNFIDNIKEKLDKKQKKYFKKFVKSEKRIIKKILKYAKVYKLPCEKQIG